MSIAMMTRISELQERIDRLEEMLAHLPKNGVETPIQYEARIIALENKYMALNARMGKRD